MMNPSRTEPSLCDLEAGPLAAEEVGARNADILVDDLAVAEPVFAGMAHHGRIPDDRKARRVARDNNLARASVRVGLRIRDRHHDGERRPVGRGGEPLMAVDDVGVAVGNRRRGHPHRVRSRKRRLGHRKTTSNLAGDKRLEPFLFLRGRGELAQDLHVAGVRGLAVEDEVPERSPAELFAQERVLHKVESGPAVLFGYLWSKQAQRADLVPLGSQRRQKFAERSRQEIAFERINLLEQEAADRSQCFLKRPRNRKIHLQLRVRRKS
jgi:hypothetical protein